MSKKLETWIIEWYEPTIEMLRMCLLNELDLRWTAHSFESWEDILDFCPEDRPDLLIVGDPSPHLLDRLREIPEGWFERISQIKSFLPDVAVVIYTDEESDWHGYVRRSRLDCVVVKKAHFNLLLQHIIAIKDKIKKGGQT